MLVTLSSFQPAVCRWNALMLSIYRRRGIFNVWCDSYSCVWGIKFTPQTILLHNLSSVHDCYRYLLDFLSKFVNNWQKATGKQIYIVVSDVRLAKGRLCDQFCYTICYITIDSISWTIPPCLQVSFFTQLHLISACKRKIVLHWIQVHCCSLFTSFSFFFLYFWTSGSAKRIFERRT